MGGWCEWIFLSGSFEDMGFFHLFQLSFDGGGVTSTHYKKIDKYVKNAHIFKTIHSKEKINTVHA